MYPNNLTSTHLTRREKDFVRLYFEEQKTLKEISDEMWTIEHKVRSVIIEAVTKMYVALLKVTNLY